MLTASFIPSDASTYASATAQVALTVLPTPLAIVATSLSRPQGASNPVLTDAVTGQVGSDTLVSVPGTLTVTSPSSLAPVITGVLAVDAAVSETFAFQIEASNAPTSYDATPLPTGLTIDTTSGLISGTPTVPGVTTVTLTATNAAGSGTTTLQILVSQPVGSHGCGSGGAGVIVMGLGLAWFWRGRRRLDLHETLRSKQS